MDRSQLLRGVLDAAVLAIVKRQDGYGYDVVRRLRAAGLTDVGDASVYGTLRRLYRGGALTSYVVPSDEGPHRRYYGITERGQAQLDEARETWMEFGAALNALLETGGLRHERDRAPDYLQALERELADLAPDERADLLEEVEASLFELDDDPVAASAAGAVRRRAARVGRAASGRRAGPRRAASAVAPAPPARRPRRAALARELAPIWWALRAFAVARRHVLLLDGHVEIPKDDPRMFFGLACSR